MTVKGSFHTMDSHKPKQIWIPASIVAGLKEYNLIPSDICPVIRTACALLIYRREEAEKIGTPAASAS